MKHVQIAKKCQFKHMLDGGQGRTKQQMTRLARKLTLALCGLRSFKRT